MSFVFTDHVHTKSFTPREHQVELLYSALERNIIICLGKTPELTFIATKLIQEFAIDNRRPLDEDGKKIIYLLEDEEACVAKALHIEQSTDLRTRLYRAGEHFDRPSFAREAQVLLLTVAGCNELLDGWPALPGHVNLLLIDKCHNLARNSRLDNVLDAFEGCASGARIVGFAVPLYSLTGLPGLLSYEIEKIESSLRCQIETASDLLSILRYSPQPREYIVAYKIGEKNELAHLLWNCASGALEFMRDHRYDPSEIYDGEFLEEINKIPDPTLKPCEMINDFLLILDNLGPWAADRAAFVLLSLVEKLKIKTPYDRHYLLLGTLTTIFVKIRAYCDSFFDGLKESEKMLKFSCPKIHRLVEVIKIFTPPEKSESDQNSDGKGENKDSKEDNNNARTNVRNYYKRPDTDIKRSKFFRQRGPTDPDLLCGLIFVENILTAKVLFHLINSLSKHEEEFRFISPLYMSEKTNDELISGRDIELEHRKQEEVLKRFRIHECNLLISTSILEEGIDIPKCNFVMRFDFPETYQSYLQCKSRARAPDALHVMLVSEKNAQKYTKKLAHYHYIEKILLTKCSSKDANSKEEAIADAYDSLLPVYKPLPANEAPKVTLNSAISLVNRYCAKLPSDTFTRLTPEWKFHETVIDGRKLCVCSLRLPINSPLKYSIKSYSMPNKALAKRMAALQMCVQLHRENEIDEYLLPVGKENFQAHPEDSEVPPLPDDENVSPVEARPGTTKRRQYYYKKIADSLIDCKPKLRKPCYLYHIRMVLSCPLPEEQNTRGRKLYPPEESASGFGILTYKKIPKLCPFPIYTRSGEVKVELKLCKESVILDDSQIDKVVSFLKYTFTNVLRLQKFLMAFDPNVSENSYIIVPVKRPTDPQSDVSVDWDFVECIHKNGDVAPTKPLEENRRNFTFDSAKYNDAVVMPWYRNQDQPQYFYVAEICNNLNPRSSFPGIEYKTFEEYYLKKYGIQIQNLEQPLLDVDHTSARLNFLTPRYVNRKGVALPTSSEETKRAKRENLEQKQILVAELCAVHPFPASLWRQAVCLPCILYRINALLLADQIRLEVARTISLGQETLPEDFEWPPLDFGWSLADVLKRSRDNEKAQLESKEAKELKESKENNIDEESSQVESDISKPYRKQKLKITEIIDGEEEDIDVKDEENEENEEVKLEIGVWSNDDLLMTMKSDDSMGKGFGGNCWGDDLKYRASPTYGLDNFECSSDDSFISESDDDPIDDDTETESPDEEDQAKKNLIIEYNNENEAEAFDKKGKSFEKEKRLGMDAQDKLNDLGWDACFNVDVNSEQHEHKVTHEENIERNEKAIKEMGLFVPADKPVTFARKNAKPTSVDGSKLQDEAYVREVSEKFEAQLKGPHLLKNVQVPALTGKRSLSRNETRFSFDHQPELEGHPGPSPSLILQALTMSNANDGINLERLETIGDSFLKYAITTYLFCTYNNIHEGKLSHLRSKQVSNLNLYRLGRRKCLGESMIATKFEPHDNWLPPCYIVPKEFERLLVVSGVPSALWPKTELTDCRDQSEIDKKVREAKEKLEIVRNEFEQQQLQLQQQCQNDELQQLRTFIPYNLITQHSIPDKSIADCVEALIGAYLIACGPRGALLFMSWLGIHVLPTEEKSVVSRDGEPGYRMAGSTPYVKVEGEVGRWRQLLYGSLKEPPSPLFYNVEDPEKKLEVMLDGYDVLERSIGYEFANRSYLLQAFTHASYQSNQLTDCYQRLEFLGDAVLDYLITRHLYEDPRQHSPGALTDLRSALVNNTIFASLAVRCGFHKYFRHLSPGLNAVIDRFVRIQEENGHSISEEYYLIGEEFDEAAEEAEDVEVPKALGDVFESLAGAIYLDSNMSLDAVWDVYYKIMHAEIEQFSSNVPKSPIRELLELEPETAKFGRPEKLADGKRVRVTVDVFGKGSFKGIGRNYRIAKCTAAKCALKKLKKARKLGV